VTSPFLGIAVGAGKGRLRRKKEAIDAAERLSQKEHEQFGDILRLAEFQLRGADEGFSVADMAGDISAEPLPGREIGRVRAGGRDMSIRHDPTQGKTARRRTAFDTHAKLHPGELPDFDPDFDIGGFLAREGVSKREQAEEDARKKRELEDAIRDIMGGDPTLTKPQAATIARGRPDPRRRTENDAGQGLLIEQRRQLMEERDKRALVSQAQGAADGLALNDKGATFEQIRASLIANYPKLDRGTASGIAASAIRKREKPKSGGIDEELDDILGAAAATQAAPPARPRTVVPPPRAAAPSPPTAAAPKGNPVTAQELDAMIDAGKTEDEIAEVVAKRGKVGW